MENATKALLIAAAVLIAILIISLGLAVYNKASTATDSADLSGAEIQAQNEKFLKYNGNKKRGSEVNALLQTVLSNNLNATEDSAKVAVNCGVVDLATDATSITTRAETSKLYDIVVNQDGPGGVVQSITIEESN